MTTSDLVKALRICFRDLDDGADCPNCPLYGNENCLADVMGGAADLLEWLISANANLHEELERKNKAIALAQKKQTDAEAERDALLERIKARRSCMDCKHHDYCEFDDATVIDCMNCVTKNCPCYQCSNSSRWEWRGLPEAPEKGEKA